MIVDCEKPDHPHVAEQQTCEHQRRYQQAEGVADVRVMRQALTYSSWRKVTDMDLADPNSPDLEWGYTTEKGSPQLVATFATAWHSADCDERRLRVKDVTYGEWLEIEGAP